MRILAGTLYTDENEFDACIEAIRRQTHRDVEHFVVERLPNKQAHDTLYRTFMQRASAFDLFVKIDADMVLRERYFFERLVERFAARPAMRGCIVSVHDFFSDRLIEGLHAYRSDVRWEANDEQLFVDRCSIPVSELVYDVDDLAPAADHCPDPSPLQAFHFGMHKGLKAVAAMRAWRRGTWRFHACNIEDTWRHFLRRRDRRLGLACLGAELAVQGVFEPRHVNFADPYVRDVLAEYESMSAAALHDLLRQWRRLHLPWLFDETQRVEWIADGPARFLARRIVPRRLHPTLSRLMRKAA